jgi:hypothetical protein
MTGCFCWECSYFETKGFCLFQKKPTKPDIKCWAKLYEMVELCESEKCSECSRFNIDCKGDRKHPLSELHEHYHYGQGKALSSEARIILISAGRQSGKTIIGSLWLYHQMLKYGDGDYLSVSSSFPLMDKKLIPSYLDFFSHIGLCKLPDDFLSAKKILKIDGMGLKANIFFGSAKNAASLESSTALAAHLDEAGQSEFSSKAYDAILGRLSRSGGKILITTTVYNLDWLYHRVYLPFTKGDPDYDVIQFESIMSPGFSKVQFEWLRSTLPSWQFDREYRGLFSRPAGLIYNDFDETIHVIKPIPIPPQWNWHVGIDPGAVHTALVWVAEDPKEKKYYLVRSYLDGNMTTKEHVAKARRFSEFGRVTQWVGGAGSEDQFRMDWKAQGIHVREPEIRDVESGIDAVTALLKENRLFIFDTEENQPLIEQLRSYSRQLDDSGQITDKIENKQKAHYADCLRYFAVGTTMRYNPQRFLTINSRRVHQSWRREYSSD